MRLQKLSYTDRPAMPCVHADAYRLRWVPCFEPAAGRHQESERTARVTVVGQPVVGPLAAAQVVVELAAMAAAQAVAVQRKIVQGGCMSLLIRPAIHHQNASHIHTAESRHKRHASS